MVEPPQRARTSPRSATPGGYYVEVACGSQVPPGEAWGVEEKGGSGIPITHIITVMARIPDLEVQVPQVEHTLPLHAVHGNGSGGSVFNA
jgi:hypothetical protein